MADDTLKYVKMDYDAHLDAIIQRVRARYPGIWNDFVNGSFGRLFLDLVAWSTASTAYLINRAASENYISTMALRESAVRLGSLVKYKLKGAAPSAVACDATLFSPASAEVLIAKGTPLRTADNTLPFEVDKDYTIAIGDITPFQTVVRFDPAQSTAGVIQTLVSVQSGVGYADLVDDTVNLLDFVEPGQLFRMVGSDTEYQIVSIDSAPDAESNNRLTLNSPWDGDTSTIVAEVIDRTITVIQGQTVTEQFITASLTKNYIAKLSRTSVLDNSVVVTVNGDVWAQVFSLYTEAADGQVFEVTTLPSGTVVVEFGDDNFGAAIPTDATVTIVYRTGGGAVGNISPGAINTTIVGLIPSLANPINITVINSRPGIGGLDAETLEEARANIPAYTRSNDRAVTLEDYQTLASNYSDPNYGQVRYALAYTRTESEFLERNLVFISAWTSGVDGTLTPVRGALKSALKSYMQSKACGTDYVQMADGMTRPVPVSIRYKVLPGADVGTTGDNLLSTMQDIISKLRPGSPLIYSDFVRTLDAVDGVDSLNMATPTSDLYPSNQDELFTPPDLDYAYSLPLQSSSTEENRYAASLPVYPLTPWAFQLFLDTAQLEVLPAPQPGFAVLSGANLSTTLPSTVNLLAGTVDLAIDGVAGVLTMKLTPVIGYARERQTALYVSYSSNNQSQLQRRSIRAALRTWASGFAPGVSIFATAQANVPASLANVADVVSSVAGVSSVNRVSLETLSNPAVKIDLDQAEIVRFTTIVLNSYSD